MNMPLPATPPEWQDPVVQELHAVREQLIEKYHGDLHAYSKHATAHALALGFKFTALKLPGHSARLE